MIFVLGVIPAEDLRKPGSTWPYGPFKPEDLATLPELDARALTDKGQAGSGAPHQSLAPPFSSTAYIVAGASNGKSNC